MLKLNSNGAVQFDVTTMLDATSTNLADIVDTFADRPTRLFYHFVSSPNCRYEVGYGKNRVPEAVAKLSAVERFRSILKQRSITGNPKGYFVNKHRDGKPCSFDSIKSVSFALAEIADMRKHFVARGSEFAICFHHDFLQSNGLLPVVYLNDNDQAQRRDLVFNAPHLVEAYSPGMYDMRWENEWRIQNRLVFTDDDIAFVIVPDSEYKTMLDWVHLHMNGPAIMPSSVYKDALDYMLIHPALDINTVGQIDLFGGLLLEVDDFFELTAADRALMQKNAGPVLKSIPRTAIAELYEYVHVQKFTTFLSQLNHDARDLDVVRSLDQIENNSKKLWLMTRELMLTGYEALFEIQRDRFAEKWQ